jgi:putative ABC transport system permease protein
LLTPYVAAAFKQAVGGIFPIFSVSQSTMLLQALCAFGVGVAAAIVPAVQASRVRIVEGLRAVG